MTTNKKFISFIAPVYNVNKYLSDFLESFLQFKDLDFEIILVNDKSKEDPKEVVDNFVDVLNIKLIDNGVNIGQGFSRNRALKHLDKSATHFMFVDPDDVLLPNTEVVISEMMGNVPVLSKSFIKWNKKRTKKVDMWRNNFYVGSRVEPSWGHVFPVSFSSIKFTARTHEDHKWMALATKDGFEWSTVPILKYRERKSSALNENNKSRNKAKQILEHVSESQKALELGLVMDIDKFNVNMRYAKVEYCYIPKRKRSKDFPLKLSRKNLIISHFEIFFQNVLQFWFFYNLFTRRNKFD